MTKFYKADNEAIFKTIFSNKNNTDLLEKLIEISIKEKVKINDCSVSKEPSLFIVNPLEVLAESPDKKSEYNIEFITGNYNELSAEKLAYILDKYTKEADAIDDYNKMSNFIQISLKNGEKDDDNLVYTYQLANSETGDTYIDNLTIYEFNLDRIKDLCCSNKNEEYKFLAALTCEKDELHELCKGDKLLEKLEQEIIKLNEDPKFIENLIAEEDSKNTHE